MTDPTIEEVNEEIEHKWLIDSLHHETVTQMVTTWSWSHIAQWYLHDGALSQYVDSFEKDATFALKIPQAEEPWVKPLPNWAAQVAIGEAPGAVRLRFKHPKYACHPSYFLTIKGKGVVAVKKPEFEVELPKPLFETLLNLGHQGQPVVKKRHEYKLPAGKMLELDVFEEEYRGLILVEVEFKSEEEAERFELPPILRPLKPKKVTDDPRYGNFSLAVNKPLTID